MIQYIKWFKILCKSVIGCQGGRKGVYYVIINLWLYRSQLMRTFNRTHLGHLPNLGFKLIQARALTHFISICFVQTLSTQKVYLLKKKLFLWFGVGGKTTRNFENLKKSICLKVDLVITTKLCYLIFHYRQFSRF